MTRLITGLLLAGLLALGCAKPPPEEASSFGAALRANKEAMIANPHAAQQGEVKGLSSRSAEHVLENYSEGQDAQEHSRAKQRMRESLEINVGR